MTLEEAFAAAREQGQALLLPYLMAGLGGVEESVDLFAAMAEGGADGFEIGIPYADPLMDGPVIMEAGRRALQEGMTMPRGIEVARRVRERTGKPCMVMTYVNPVLRMGAGEFAGALSEAGVEAVIVPDLPVEESGEIAAALADSAIGLVLFAAPTTTGHRLALVARARPPFVYGISEMGVTGEREGSGGLAKALVARIRAATDVPVVLGVGISGPKAAREAARLADGVIVGSALVRRVLEAESASAAKAALTDTVATLAEAVRTKR